MRKARAAAPALKKLGLLATNYVQVANKKQLWVLPANVSHRQKPVISPAKSFVDASGRAGHNAFYNPAQIRVAYPIRLIFFTLKEFLQGLLLFVCYLQCHGPPVTVRAALKLLDGPVRKKRLPASPCTILPL